jgi:hypothetical protein
MRLKCGFRRLAVIAATCAALVVSFVASGDLATTLQKGISWLSTQAANTTLFADSASVATLHQERSEAAQTLKLLATVPDSLSEAVTKASDVAGDLDTETISRRLLAYDAKATGTDVLLTDLLARQNSDGGFAGAPGYASNTMDTAWAVLALAQQGRGDANEAQRGRAFLSGKVTDTGVDSLTGSGTSLTATARIYHAALTSVALQSGSDSSSITGVKRLTSYLLSSQGSDGGWQADTTTSAWALLALTPVAADSNYKTLAQNFLASRQQADGSWNSDPYITAIALRALSLKSSGSSQSGSDAASASITGSVVDASSGQTLEGVSVTLQSGAAGGVGSAVPSDTSGAFKFSSLAAGTYQLTLARAGYSSATLSLTIVSAQAFSVGVVRLAPSPTTGILKGSITAQDSGLSLAGAVVTLTGANNQTATTDSSGRFEFSSLAPGATNISVTLSGYAVITASATVAAGQTLLFSPSLPKAGADTPTTGVFSGAVADAGTGQALAGVAVTISGASSQVLTTDSTGQFSVTLAPGAYAVSYAKTGYGTVAQSLVLSAGSSVSAGTVKLYSVPTKSSLSGKVYGDTGQAISGAQIEIANSNPLVSVKSADDGAYALTNIAGSRFDVRVSASGYTSQLFSVQMDSPADVQHNFTLATQQAGTLVLGSLALDKGNVQANTDLSGTLLIQNTGTAPIALSGVLLIEDSSNNTVAKGSLVDESKVALGNFTLAAGQSRTVAASWNSQQFAPGMYQFVIQFAEPSTRSAARPLGVVLAERGVLFSIGSDQRITGSAAVTPPVTRAGTSSSVRLTSVLQNAGNSELVAQVYKLTVTNSADNSVAYSTTVSGAKLSVGGLLNLDFGSWVANTGGNYIVSVAAADAAVSGSASTKLYVGDSGSASFTLNKTLVPTGNQSAHATIKVTGQDVNTGVISDPLAPLIKTAVEKAVLYNDKTAYNWTLTNNCQGCHVQPQAYVSGEKNVKLVTDYNKLQRATILNNTLLNQIETGQYDEQTYGRQYPADATMFGLWSLNFHPDRPSIASSIKLAADWVTTQQESSGSWFGESFNCPQNWGWCFRETFTGSNVHSLIEAYNLLSTVSPDTVKTYATETALPAVNALGNLSGNFVQGGDGYFYVSLLSGKVVQLSADGVLGTVWSGFSTGADSPGGLAWVKGKLVVATSSGLYQLLPDGTSQKLSSAVVGYLAANPDGTRLFGFIFGDQTIYEIDTTTWARSVWTSGGPLNYPTRSYVDSDNNIYIPNYYGNNILKYSADKTYSVIVPAMYGHPEALTRIDGYWYVSSSNGIFKFNDNWEGQRLITADQNGMVFKLNDGMLYISRYNNSAVRIKASTTDIAASMTKYLAAIDKGTTWLMNDSTSGSGDALQVTQHLIGLGEARKFYLTRDTARADAIATKMATVATYLRSKVNTDGGWGRYWETTSDPLATAQAGYALDYTDPSPSDPLIRNAVTLLLNKQQTDGSWKTTGVSTNMAATTWVAIWLPVMLDRLGGIDTDLTIQSPANVTPSAFNPAPTTSTPQADGSVLNKWTMTGVTSAGRTVEFDLAFANLLPNEQRAAASAAFLSFKNSFTGEVVDSSIDIPKITATAQLNLTLQTDKTSYYSDTPVLLTAGVLNGSATATNTTVKLEVYSADGKLVGDLGTFASGTVAASATATVNAVWNTASNPVGAGYIARATLYDANGNYVSQTQTSFDIVSSASQQVSARIATDKSAYSPTDTVQLTDRLANLVANSARDGLSMRTVVLAPTGAIQWQVTEPIGQLLGGATKELGYSVGIVNAAAGQYTATLSALDASGNVVASASTQFAVRDSSADGAGISGTIAASPKQISAGDNIAFNYGVSNRGNSILNALPLKVRVIDPLSTTTTPLAEIAATADLPINAIVNGAKNWLSSSDQAQKSLVVLLVASFGGKDIVLAQDSFTITKPALNASVTATPVPEARVLALVSCPTTGSGDTSSTGIDQGTTTDGTVHADIAACVAQRKSALDNYLTSLGVAHTIVTTREEFATAFHCGIYNTYWIVGGLQKLDATLAKEVREAVERGNGLIADSLRNASKAGTQVLPQILGTSFASKAGESVSADFLTDSTLASGSVGTVGEAMQITPSSANILARFSSLADQPAAATLNAFGSGHAVLFAFDLADTLALQTADQADDLRKLVANTLIAVKPQIAVPHVGRPFSAQIQLANTGGLKAQATVTATIPAGFVLDDAAPALAAAAQAQSDGSSLLRWAVALGTGESRNITLRLHAGFTAGHFDMPVSVSLAQVDDSGAVGTAQAATRYVLPVDVAAGVSLAGDVLPVVQALAPTTDADVAARTLAVSLITKANASIAQSAYPDALDSLTQAADALRSISNADTSAARLSVAQGLESVAPSLCRMLGCITGSISLSTRQIPLTNTIVMGRTVYNNCPPQIKDIPVTALLIRERTGATELTLWDNLTIPGYQNNLRQAGWQALGQEGDILSLNLSAVWMNHFLQLDRQSFEIIVPPPVLTGSVTAPATARANDNVNISWKVSNSGAIGKDIPVALRFTNLTQGVALTSFNQSLTLNPNQTSTGNYNWFSSGNVGDQIQVQLVGTVKNVEQILGTAVLTLKQ